MSSGKWRPFCLDLNVLTHWGRDNMAASLTDDIFEYISSNESFWILNKISPKICYFGSNWQYDSIGSDNALAPNRRQAIIWSNVGMLYRRIYASLGLKELRKPDVVSSKDISL